MAWWNEIPLAGGLLGGIFGNPEEEAHQASLKQAQERMWAYRPEAMDARMNVMGNMSHAFAPTNNMLTQMYGQGAAPDMNKMVQNPFSPEAIARMRQMGQGAPKPQPFRPQYDATGDSTGSSSDTRGLSEANKTAFEQRQRPVTG